LLVLLVNLFLRAVIDEMGKREYAHGCKIRYNTFCINQKLKQFFIFLSLRVIRFLVWLKPHVFSFTQRAIRPLQFFWRFALVGLVPLYHALYLVRKQLALLYRPAKNKVMVLVANRYVVHLAIICLVFATVLSNVRTNEVRAETFGQKSLLFSLVANQDELIEEYASADLTALQVSRASYRDQGVLTPATRGIDFIGSETTSLDSVLSDSSLVGVQESGESAAQMPPARQEREDIELYVVEGGDTLSTIAGKFGLSLNTILWANNLTVRSVLQPGDTLTILPVDGAYHEVSSGDTVASIARTYGVDQETIARYNDLTNVNALAIGDELLIPGGEVQVASRPTSSAISTIISPSPSSSTGATATISNPSVTGSGSMIWPTDLRIITQYYGWSHTGIDIDCGYTNDNYASDAGYVQFSGWKGGYGYAVEINHGNGLVTRYGHHASLYVTAGQYVSQGQAIGRCGTTGRSTGTHLHFEVMANGAFRNPLEYAR